MDRLSRTRLLLGDENVAKLQAATVMIVGVGAVGSFACEALARSGIGKLILIDFDKYDITNINRQLFATDSTLGSPKVSVAAARIHEINPDIMVDARDMFWDENSNPDLRPDFVIDAIDTVPSKIALYRWCQAQNIPFISSMGAARKTDMSQIKIAKISKTSVCPLAAKIRHAVKDTRLKDFPVVYSIEPADQNIAPGRVFGSIITITGTFGLAMANYAIKQIIKK